MIEPVDDENLTPGMRQYMSVKQKHPDCIVLFRMGDFYETFYEDAKTAARELEITLTSRGKGEKRAPLAGIPYHALQPYLGKLISKGFKVCIVEQMEDPRKAKGLVKRDILRIITPGTVMDETILNEKSNNYIMAINKEKNEIAIALCDVSTGEFSVIKTVNEKLESELNKYLPSEIILPMSLEHSEFRKSLKDQYVSYLDDLHYFHDKAKQDVEGHFKNGSVTDRMDKLLMTSAGALLHYLHTTQKDDLKHINRIKTINTDDCMLIDKVTTGNLNIFSNRRSDKATLLSVLDHTKTSMGSRLLKKWLQRPLVDVDEINKRLDGVDEIKNDIMLKEELSAVLGSMQDIERMIARISLKTANPKDLVALRNTLNEIPRLNLILNGCKSEFLHKKIDEFVLLREILANAIKDEPNSIVREGNIIKDGYNKELDEIRSIKRDSRQWLSDFETEEKEKTGIKFLKVKYNNVFGYFIEVSKSNLGLVPQNYERKQTQLNCERYITPELKEKENMILNADEKIGDIEFSLFNSVLEETAKYTSLIQEASDKISEVDVAVSFGDSAILNNYCRPVLNLGNDLSIIGGRHPIVEKLEQSFISNDLVMDQNNRMMIITGPNMAGKSVYIKQNALIVIMAQIGCFVPCKECVLGVVDRIFSRVGASDDISSGHSTFMVEMNETANILANATSRSFVILDEIGRGTSTYDGVSLAWSIAEYIVSRINAKTLFATHYHHLNKMADEFPGIKNFNIAVSEREDEIIFLRKIVEGGTDRSYGIQVAKLAGLPSEVIENSKRIITQLEMEDEIGEMIHKNLKSKKRSEHEMREGIQKTLLDMEK